MDKNNINKQDEILKDLFSGTRMKAGENLKYRIMQQIETEKALSQKKVRSSRPILGNMLSIFGVMYAVIGIVGFFVYFTAGQSALNSLSFYGVVIFIASICSVFWMISTYDDQRRSKQKGR